MASPYQSHMPKESGTVSLSAAQTSNTTTLGFTPSWVVIANTVGAEPVSVAISGTTAGLVTFSRAGSTSAATVYFLAG